MIGYYFGGHIKEGGARGHVASMAEKKESYWILVGTLKKRGLMEDQGVDGRIQ